MYIYMYLIGKTLETDKETLDPFYTTLYHMTRCQGIVCLRDPIYFF